MQGKQIRFSYMAFFTYYLLVTFILRAPALDNLSTALSSAVYSWFYLVKIHICGDDQGVGITKLVFGRNKAILYVSC